MYTSHGYDGPMTDPGLLEPREDLEDPLEPNAPVPDAERAEPSFLDDEEDDFVIDVDDPEGQLEGDEF